MMLKSVIFLATLVAAVSAGWASGLFWFGWSQVVSGVRDIAVNCPAQNLSCAVGAIQAVFGTLAVVGGGIGAAFGKWRRSEGGVYHIYEEGYSDVESISRMVKLGGANERGIDLLKLRHVGKDNEATIIYHHKDGSLRRMLYHYSNETAAHLLHASFSTIAKGEDLIRRETVGINDGFGAAYNDLDAGTWDNVDHASNDIAYWTSHTISGLQDNDADSFCMGFQDPDNGNENVMALRVQPANEGDYGGVNFDACGSNNFRRGPAAAFSKLASQSERAARELRMSIKSRLGWGKDKFASRVKSSPLEARQNCPELDCDTDDDCELFGCELQCSPSRFKCSLNVQCGGHPSNC